MITVSFDDMTAGPDDLPLLRIADAANRIHGMDARLLPGLLESSWLDWTPPSSRLPDVGMPSPPGRDDWLWARGHAGLLGFDVSAYGSGMMFASILAKRVGVRRAGWAALALAWCARMARLDARAWTLALLEHDPARVSAGSHRLLPVSPPVGVVGRVGVARVHAGRDGRGCGVRVDGLRACGTLPVGSCGRAGRADGPNPGYGVGSRGFDGVGFRVRRHGVLEQGCHPPSCGVPARLRVLWRAYTCRSPFSRMVFASGGFRSRVVVRF